MKHEIRDAFMDFGQSIRDAGALKDPILAKTIPWFVDHVDALSTIIQTASSMGISTSSIKTEVDATWEALTVPYGRILIASNEEFDPMFSTFLEAYRVFLGGRYAEFDDWVDQLSSVGLSTIHRLIADYIANATDIVNPETVIMARLTDLGIETFIISEIE